MARVTIGVPVYNGGRLIAESLECLRTQSFEDIEVLIGDNASGDETADICADFAARDPRFHHIRRSENVGSLRNFQDLRQRARTELFCWRAHDDLSDPNFVETLVGLFDRDPAIRLAVCRVDSVIDDRPAPRITPYRAPPERPRIARIAHQLFSSHASWIYGLWHRETLGQLQDRVHAEYSYEWGWDHLTLLPLILDGTIAGTNETRFIQRIFRAGTTRAERQARQPSVAEARARRVDFSRTVDAMVEERHWSFAERPALAAILPFYIDRRGHDRLRLLVRSIRERGAGHPEA